MPYNTNLARKKRKHHERSDAEESNKYLNSRVRTAEVGAQMNASAGSVAGTGTKRALPAFMQAREREVSTKRDMPSFLKTPPNVDSGQS